MEVGGEEGAEEGEEPKSTALQHVLKITMDESMTKEAKCSCRQQSRYLARLMLSKDCRKYSPEEPAVDAEADHLPEYLTRC